MQKRNRKNKCTRTRFDCTHGDKTNRETAVVRLYSPAPPFQCWKIKIIIILKKYFFYKCQKNRHFTSANIEWGEGGAGGWAIVLSLTVRERQNKKNKNEKINKSPSYYEFFYGGFSALRPRVMGARSHTADSRARAGDRSQNSNLALLLRVTPNKSARFEV